MLDPAQANEKAPELFRAKFETTRGDVVLEVHRDWAPRGADRFYNLVRIGFFSDIALFRIVKRPNPFMAQFGIHGDPKISATWDKARIQDDPVGESNSRGRITLPDQLVGTDNDAKGQVSYQFRKLDLTLKK